MFLPSGRVHAIGAGLVIFEIQQNSDTTYRVFDWNRAGLDGKSRELHIAESLASIDFDDFAPALVSAKITTGPNFKCWQLVQDPLFTVEKYHLATRASILWRRRRLQIVGVLEGGVTVTSTSREPGVTLPPGGFCLVPACLEAVEFWTEPNSSFLRVEAG